MGIPLIYFALCAGKDSNNQIQPAGGRLAVTARRSRTSILSTAAHIAPFRHGRIFLNIVNTDLLCYNINESYRVIRESFQTR